MSNLDQQLSDRYKAEGIDPLTGAYCIMGNIIYRTVAGMEILAMRSGLLTGKDAVVFGPPIQVTCPKNGTEVTVPEHAIATYYRLVMDQVCQFQSDPVQFTEYANNGQQWHFEKGYMFLAKIARSCALRHAFPDIFAGTISYEEAQCELSFDKQASRTVTKPLETGLTEEKSPNGNNVRYEEVQTGMASAAGHPPQILVMPDHQRESVSATVANIFKK